MKQENLMVQDPAIYKGPSNAVLVGLESVGKSSLFRILSDSRTGDEANFRGSTVNCRKIYVKELKSNLVDTPGIRIKKDSETTRITLQQIGDADSLILVIRGTHVKTELKSLIQILDSHLFEHKVTLVITFKDKVTSDLNVFANYCRNTLGIPVTIINTRKPRSTQLNSIFTAIRDAAHMRCKDLSLIFPEVATREPQITIFEHTLISPWLSLLCIVLIFALPVYSAYTLANWLQPIFDNIVIIPLTEMIKPLMQSTLFLSAILIGEYGLITLGWYSFLWAFPVVLLIGLNIALTEEIGLKDRITAALDPWLHKIGLSGRDLIPVLTGFGCNVVAVFQTRSCSACTRKTCVSLIAFGSACSYQIGASLSLFNSAKAPWLFLPYLLLLFFVAAIHTRIWNKALPKMETMPLSERAFLQFPTFRGTIWRIQTVLKQFIFQAMPIFLAICVAGALLQYLGILELIANLFSAFLTVFNLPETVAPGLIFSIVRKDGLLVLNQGEGALLSTLSAGQIFILVYLASTLTPCMVTLLTVRKELGGLHALSIAYKQAVTSIVSSFLLAILVSHFHF